MITIKHPERIDYYGYDGEYLFGGCDCDLPLLYRIPVKKTHKSPHVYKYKCIDCGYEGEVYDCDYDCDNCECTIEVCRYGSIA